MPWAQGQSGRPADYGDGQPEPDTVEDLMFDPKKLLEEAGPPYNTAEANTVRPDEDGLKRLVRRSGIQ